MKMRSQSSRSTRCSPRLTGGFSLVEVVLAVGIMALGVVTILGLLPHGLEITRNTANELAETRIIEQLVGELQASDWEVVEGAEGLMPKRFFDDQGLELEESDTGFAIRVSYVAQAEVAEPDVLLPTNAATPADNQNLRRVTVKVVAVPLPSFDFTNPTPGTPIKAFTQLVVKMR